MQLVLDTNGLIIKKRNKSFHIHTKTKDRLISPKRVDSILITKDILLTTSAIKLAVKHRIPIIIMNPYGGVKARMWMAGYGTDAEIRRNQIHFIDKHEALLWVLSIFEIKGEEQMNNLAYLKNRNPPKAAISDNAIKQIGEGLEKMQTLSQKYENIHTARQSIMGTEGAIARKYWQTVAEMLPPEYYFAKRSRRPALDHFNASLNYLYGMLYAEIESAAIAAGLDTQFGFLHTDNYNKPTLCYDLIEPFRPWIDRLLIEQYVQKKIRANFFRSKNGGVFLCKKGKKHLIPLFHQMMDKPRDFQKRRMSTSNHINVFIGKFSNSLKNMNK